MDHWRPRRILFLTGLDWAVPFLDGLGCRKTRPGGSPVELVGTVPGGGRVVVAPHPRRKRLGELEDGIARAFG